MFSKENLINGLIAAGCLKIGEFKLKNGTISPYYVDLREATEQVALFQDLLEIFKEVLNNKIPVERENLAIVGVPYGVVPLAGAVAGICKLAYHPIRKEQKGYGAELRADNNRHSNYVIIEDVMTTGSSILETLAKMDSQKVSDVIVIVNREAGGEQNLKEKYPHIRVHSLVNLSDIMAVFKSKE